MALPGPVPALSRGHRSGLTPQLYKGDTAPGQPQPVLVWDMLPLPHRCRCPWADSAGKGQGCSVPVVGSPASSSCARVLEQLPSLCLGLPAMEARNLLPSWDCLEPC